MNKALAIVLVVGMFLAGCAAHAVRVRPEGVQFDLRVKGAEQVALACSVDRFTLHEATRVRSGTWSVVVPFAGPFTYFYRVDGQTFLPDCPLTESDDFGASNCIHRPGL